MMTNLVLILVAQFGTGPATDYPVDLNLRKPSAKYFRPGSWLAYQSIGQGPSTVWRMDLRGANRGPLTVPDGSFEDVHPAVSPDAKWVVLTRLRKKRSTGQLILVSAVGDVSRVLTTGTQDDWGRFSPDGKRVVFQRSGKLWMIGFDGKGARSLGLPVPGRHPTWSPDGSQIAFTGGPERGDIYVVKPNGQGLRRLTNTGWSAQPRWASASTLVFTDRSKSAFQFMDVKSGRVTKGLPVNGWYQPNQWTAGAGVERAIFTATSVPDGKRRQIVMMPLSGGRVKNLSGSDSHDDFPALPYCP